MGFPGGSEGKTSACNVGDSGLIPGSGRSPGEGSGNPIYSLVTLIMNFYRVITVVFLCSFLLFNKIVVLIYFMNMNMR